MNMNYFAKPGRWASWLLLVLLGIQFSFMSCQPTHSPTSATDHMARKTRIPASWLQSIRAADIAFIGEASVTEDTASTAAITGIRGGGYAITANVVPTEILWGTPSDTSYVLTGASKREPNHRLTIGETIFPPDALHQISYWEYARKGETMSVLVLGTNPARVVPATDTSLLEAIRLVRGWEQANPKPDQEAIIAQLMAHPRHPIAYVAAFDGLAKDHSDIPGLFQAFCQKGNMPSVATQSILNKLSLAATHMPAKEIQTLAYSLIGCWHTEKGPEAISGYLDWFSAHKSQTWAEDSTLRAQLMEEVERVRAIQFEGVYGEAWTQQIQYQVSLFSQ